MAVGHRKRPHGRFFLLGQQFLAVAFDLPGRPVAVILAASEDGADAIAEGVAVVYDQVCRAAPHGVRDEQSDRHAVVQQCWRSWA